MNSQKNQPESFSRSYRITQTSEFLAFKDKAVQKESYTNPYFQIFFKPNSFNFARMAIIVNKRVSKKAVSRNLIKRIVRESFRKLQFNGLADLDFLIIARSRCIEIEKFQIAQSLQSALIEISKSAKSIIPKTKIQATDK